MAIESAAPPRLEAGDEPPAVGVITPRALLTVFVPAIVLLNLANAIAIFLYHHRHHHGAFTSTAAYLGREELDRPVFGNLGPEMSRRTRAFAVWATLRAYGRDGYRAMVERHVALARRLGEQVDAEPELERLAEVTLNVVCFRYRPAGVAEEELDELNRRLGQAVLDDGRVYFGTTVYDGKVAFRPAIVNWRTRPEDVDLIVPITLELGALVAARV